MQPAANNRKGRPSGRPFSCAWQFESHSSDHNMVKAGAKTGKEPGQASFTKTGTGIFQKYFSCAWQFESQPSDHNMVKAGAKTGTKNRDRHLSEISYHLPGLPLIVR